jgi:hypothetical protein
VTTELDAGLDNSVNASQTTCNPITNAGCTGTDLCSTDNSGNFWVCYQTGGGTFVQTCGDCTASTAVCGVDNICISYVDDAGDNWLNECVRYCCTDADCGDAGAGSCNTAVLDPPLPNGVGICSR